ncbi:uncharacterized protein LOC115438149 isoform X2 [Sphaeramia orbicularis]|uniref:uncharacterized protein LOC115438149 isoform X2 n=1 Tax=Sphaeramia orbicularis TaxID=375764 RepID=UPI00117BE2FC|nr:uncharacterized protein LOC115438149 isoform X2 [Sphaeramia orbicularis]
MTTKSGEVNSAPCGELRFYICSSKAKSNVMSATTSNGSNLVPGFSLFDVMLDQSSSVLEDILHWSSFLSQVRSGRLSERCLTSFIQQEALYLHRVSSTLEVLIGNIHEEDQDIRSLLVDVQQQYRTQYRTQYSTQYSTQVLPSAPPSRWLLLSLLSFHSVVLDLTPLPPHCSVSSSRSAQLHLWNTAVSWRRVKGHQPVPAVDNRRWKGNCISTQVQRADREETTGDGRVQSH